MKVLVFGAGGYIGRYLTTGLSIAGGLEVICASSSDGTSMDGVTGRISSRFVFPAGVDTAIYLSQSPHWRNGPDNFDHVLAVNCGAAVKLAAMAKTAGVRRFIFASTGTVYKPSMKPLAETSEVNRQDWYSLSKLYAEEALLNLAGSMNVSCFRLFGVYGPGQDGRLVANIAKKIATKQAIAVDGNVDTGCAEGMKLTMTHIDDLVSAWSQLIYVDYLPPVLNVAGDQFASIRDIAVGIAGVLSHPVTFEETKVPITGHFVADVSKMKQLISQSFRPLSNGFAFLGDSIEPSAV